MTCSRNAANRDHSAIHMVNKPVGDSILKKSTSLRSACLTKRSLSSCLESNEQTTGL